ncbi:2-dehydropantoate 2-reductase [Fundicoccus culcitae]|uniref:2-dehydropantoate 2-reductase n=1 Tax=Fundicoccus culcitae TaxID=2969821 RepID=A0ABY5P5X4_9LACT|nr:2-dehydropantoate 2-reductase [Fundicoccus culcitae]UUX33976.1 2-dehydropantoate 2-reductase [Fundicoccus culcitae]
MKIAIAGSGALGSSFGFMLQKGGHDVTLMDYWDEQIQTIREHGLTANVNGVIETIRIPIDKPENIQDSFDVVFMFTKSMGLRHMLKAIAHTLTVDTKIVCLLNGLGHAKTIAEYIPTKNIIMGTTVWTAGLDAPGKVHLMGHGPVEIQESDPSGKSETLAIVKVLQDCGLNGVYSEDVHFTTWRKACVNGTMNSLSAILDANIEELFSSTQTHAMVKEIVKEFAAAAEIDGVDLNVDEIVDYINQASVNLGSHYPSMHQDISNRRFTEIDFLNGTVAKMCEDNNIPAPYCRLITQLIHAKEEILGVK